MDPQSESRQSVAFVAQPGCAPFSETKRIGFPVPCDRWQAELYPYLLKSSFKRFVFVDMWPAYVQGSLCLLTERNCGLDLTPSAYEAALGKAYQRLAMLWKALRQQGKDVVVFETVPYPDDPGDPTRLYDRVAAGERLETLDFSYRDFARKNATAAGLLRAAADDAGVLLVDPASSMCPAEQCPIVRSGRPLYADPYHLRSSMMNDPRFSIFDQYILSNEPTVPMGQ